MNTKLKSPRISRTTARANIWNYDAALVHRDVTGAFVLGRVGAAGQGHRRNVIRRTNAGAINDWNVAGHDAADIFKSGSHRHGQGAWFNHCNWLRPSRLRPKRRLLDRKST